MDPHELRSLAARDRDLAFAEAAKAMESDDRNLRVAALRVVGADGRREGANVIVAGLLDAKSRVRQVALTECKPYLADKSVVAAIVAIIQNEAETARLRSKALLALGGAYASPNRAGRIPAAALSALESLAEVDRFRGAVLQRLVTMDVTPDVEALLREYVRTGTKDEAVAATRALCGYRLVNWGSATPSELRAAGAEPAGGVMYWIRRDAPTAPPY
jgi:hypothetical protein